jgi:presenilin-like A22 family membrane protease
MEVITRKPFQGVTNIGKFNWHFYVFTLIVLVVIFLGDQVIFKHIHTLTIVIALLIIFSVIASLVVSFYVYNWSNLYQLQWLNKIDVSNNKKHIIFMLDSMREVNY